MTTETEDRDGGPCHKCRGTGVKGKQPGRTPAFCQCPAGVEADELWADYARDTERDDRDERARARVRR